MRNTDLTKEELEIPILFENLIEFELKEYMSLFYNVDKNKWYVEWVDMVDGEEYKENLSEKFQGSIKIGDYILTESEFKECKKRLEEVLEENK